jgi:serine/threonine protein kinase
MISVYPPVQEPESDATEILGPGQVEGAYGDPLDTSLPSGSLLGEYVVDARLGGGGGGSVYAAHDLASGERVAIKVLHPEMSAFPAMVKRFAREASAVSNLCHPNIVKVLASGEVRPGQPYYVMELLEGRDLKRMLLEHGRFSVTEAISIMLPVCEAVAAAHAAGVVHRDIKANNVFVVELNGQRVIKLLDFGIAKLLAQESQGQGLTEPGAMLGTAHSMAPEQVRCERADERSDIYALGVLLYQLLTGQYPFHAPDPRHIALMHLQTPAPRPSLIAPVGKLMDAIVLRCMEKQPAQRFQDATSLMQALTDARPSAEQAQPDSYDSAVGIFVELTIAPDYADDDDATSDACDVLDATEESLAPLGFTFPVKSSSSVLGVRIDEKGAHEQEDQAEAIFSELRRKLESRRDAHPAVQVSVSMTMSQAACRRSGPNLEVIGGPVLEVATWMNQDRTRVS